MSAPDSKQTVKTATPTATEDAGSAATSDSVCEHRKQSKAALATALYTGSYLFPDPDKAESALSAVPRDILERFDTIFEGSGLSRRKFDQKTHRVEWHFSILPQANLIQTNSVTRETTINCESIIAGYIVDKLTGERLKPGLYGVSMLHAIPISYKEATKMAVRHAFGSTEYPPPKDQTQQLIDRVVEQLLEDQSDVEERLGHDAADIPQKSKLITASLDVAQYEDLEVACTYNVHRLDDFSELPRSVEVYFSIKKKSGEWGVIDHQIEVAETAVVASGGEEEA